MITTAHTSIKKSLGFTMVEVAVVIVVIGILATIAVIGFSAIRNKVIDDAMQSDILQASKIMANGYASNGYYDSNFTSLNNFKTSNGNVLTPSASGTGINATLTLVITNPGTVDSYSVTMVPKSGPTLPKLQTNPYISSPLEGATYSAGNCGAIGPTTLFSSGGGTPTPTIQWQIMSPKNSTSGTWSNVSGGTTANYTYTIPGLNYGDYQLFRVIYTTNGNAVTSPSETITIDNTC